MMSDALLIAENGALWSPCRSSPLNLLPFLFFWRVRDISVDILIKASNWYDDCSASRRGRFSSEGSRVFIAEEAAESKAPSRSPQVSALRLSSVFGFETDIQTHHLIKMDCCIGGELSCCSGNDIQCDERVYRNISTTTTPLFTINTGNLQ